MSYSIFVHAAASKEEAKNSVADKFDDVVVAQEVHKVDKEAALAAANAFIDMLVEPPEGHVLQVTVSGSLSWREAEQFFGSNLSIAAHIRLKEHAGA